MLIIWNKTEGRSSQGFRNYQNPKDFFKSLRHGNVNSREVLKNQSNFKSDLDEIKTGNPQWKSEDQIRVRKNVEIFFI